MEVDDPRLRHSVYARSGGCCECQTPGCPHPPFAVSPRCSHRLLEEGEWALHQADPAQGDAEWNLLALCPSCAEYVRDHPPAPGVPAGKEPQGWAIGSVALGVLSFVCCVGAIAGPLAIICGVMALVQKQKLHLAAIGIVLGFFGSFVSTFGGAIVVPRLLGAGRQARETALKGTLHLMRNSIGLFHEHNGCYPEKLEDLMRGADDPALQGITGHEGEGFPISPKDWRGPYLETPDGNLPNDPITGAYDWTYTTRGPDVGDVHSSATGSGLDGSLYSRW